jgi:hypothetical protein
MRDEQLGEARADDGIAEPVRSPEAELSDHNKSSLRPCEGYSLDILIAILDA